jgi:crotonobetainyl-CoA:carnitine CoA-transferase CaiB-like acyl-CoA transferase
LPLFDEDGVSLYYQCVNRGKYSIRIDLKSPADRSRLDALVQTADVVIENFRPRVRRSLGLEFEDFVRLNPKVVFCSLTGFGDTGPYADRPAYDIIIQAMSGGMSITGHPEDAKGPVSAGVPIADMSGGLMVSLLAILGLYIREITGEAVRLDSSLLEVQLSFLSYMAAFYLNKGAVPSPQGSGHPTGVVYRAFKASDGYLVVVADNDAHWVKMCRALGKDEWADDPRLRTVSQRKEVKAAILSELERIFANGTVSDWCRRLMDHGVPCSPINSVADILEDEHVRNALQQVVALPNGGKKWYSIGTPLRINGVRPTATRMPPAFDQDSARYPGHDA